MKGERHIPIKLLDVAGLIPGASEGKGLGNKVVFPSVVGLVTKCSSSHVHGSCSVPE